MALTILAGVVLGIFAGLFFGLRQVRDFAIGVAIMLLLILATNLVINSLHLFVGGKVGRIAVSIIAAIIGISVYSVIVKNRKTKNSA